MKVKLVYGRAGEGFSQAAGEIVEMEADEAQRYVEDGLAELVDAPKRAAKANAKKPAERAEKRGSSSAKG